MEYSDVVQCGVYVDIKNYPMDGTSNNKLLDEFIKNLNYKQTHQIMPIWNGFHLIVLMTRDMDMDTYLVYL